MKILIAIDQSPFWTQVVDAVLNRNWAEGTQFKILTVIEPLPAGWDDFADEEWKVAAHELAERRHRNTEKLLVEARQRLLQKLSQSVVHTDLRTGRARDEIVNAAIDWAPDRIILGAHGRSPNRLFPGAVSHSVARHAPCSVELVRLKEPPQEVPARKSSVETQRPVLIK